MSLAGFRTAAKKAANIYADRFGLSPEELEYALIANADLEGGLGEEAGVGDGGASVGRYQFNTAGGHGSTLLQQGYTKDQIAKDEFAVDHWAPILAQGIAAEKAAGKKGDDAIASAIFKAERPAVMYPPDRVAKAFNAASQMTGQPTSGGSAQGSQGAAGGGSTVADTSDGAAGGDTQSAKILAQLQGILGMEPQGDDPRFAPNNPDGTPNLAQENYFQAHKAWAETFTAVDNLYKNLAGVEGRKDQHHADLLADFQAKTTATHYQNQDAQTKAQSDINSFFAGQSESRLRAADALKGQEDLIKWGTAPGKSSYSANDLGAAFANTMRQAGMDPSKGMLNYTGTTYLDPIGDMQRGDNLLGATGKPPSSANLLTGETDPNAGGGGTSISPPAFASNIGGAIKGALPKIGDGRPAGYDLFDHSTGSPGGAFDGLTTPAYSNATGATPGGQNLLRGAGLTWDKAPALFKWG